MYSLSRMQPVILYKSLIVPHIDYGDVVYDAASKKDCQTLQVIQNGCLCICCKADPRTPMLELHRRANIPVLADRRSAHSCNIVFNGLSGNSTNGINNMFTFVHDAHTVNTCSSSNHHIMLPKYRLTKSQGNLQHRGAKYYNRLPQHVKNATTIESFKRNMKSHLAS